MIGARRGDSASVRAAKKRVNTFLLDMQQCTSLTTCLFVFLVIFGLLTVWLAFSLQSMSTLYNTDTENLTQESEKLRSFLKEQVEDKKVIQQQVAVLEEELDQCEVRIASLNSVVSSQQKRIDELIEDAEVAMEEMARLRSEAEIHRSLVPSKSPSLTIPSSTVVSSGTDVVRQQAVKAAMSHAWDSYVKYAWGKDELKPVSQSHSNWLNLGLTIVDALDTLWIMDLKDEFQAGADWVRDHLSFDTPKDVSLFETCIRELGGLLSAYEFSRDRMFLDKSADLAERLLRGFNSDSGLPFATINLKTGAAKSPGWTSGASVLSEMGTLQMEYLYLAYHLNRPDLSKKPMDVFRHLDGLHKNDGLYPLYVHPRTGQFQGKDVSLGALGDSFYEYQLKLWLLTNKQADGYRRMFDESMNGVLNTLIHKTKPNGLTYVGQLNKSGNLDRRLEHLACFAGGMFALGATTAPPMLPRVTEYMDAGAGITETCHWAYNRTQTGIGPEYIEINDRNDFNVPARGKHYLLRPETVESFFYLWRLTHDPKYREWGWEAFQAIEKHCRTPSGYSGIYDVNSASPQKDDLQQSFFLAETLKYLYLLFSDDDVIPLDQYVFNTEAHPLHVIEESLDLWPQELRFQLLVS